MELFNEFRNKSVNSFMCLAERIANGEIFSVKEFEEEYYRLSGDDKWRKKKITKEFYENVIFSSKFNIFDLRNKDKVKLCIDINSDDEIHILNIPLKTEKMWLHTALHDKLSRLFFTDEEIRFLDNGLSEYQLYYEHIDDAWRNGEDITEITAANFRTILQAINEKKSLTYTYRGKNEEGTPVKIEYDERICKIYAIFYNDNRFIKSDISRLSDIVIKEQLHKNIPEIKQEMLEKKGYKPVVFTVTDNKDRGAIERALVAFSVYDHAVDPIDEKTARFTIQYYRMDLDILIKDILAFGADIKVESPQIVVDKIKEILEKI